MSKFSMMLVNQEANPDMSDNDIRKKLHDDWDSMSEKEKKPWVEEYKSQMATYKVLPGCNSHT